MKLFLTLAALGIVSTAEACPQVSAFARLRDRTVSRSVTVTTPAVTTTTLQKTVSYVPTTVQVEKTVYVPTKVVESKTVLKAVFTATPVTTVTTATTTTRTVTRAGWWRR